MCPGFSESLEASVTGFLGDNVFTLAERAVDTDSFVFDPLGARGVVILTGDDPARQHLADAMHADWIAFARGDSLPWPAYDAEARATRIYDRETATVSDPDGMLRELWPS